MKLNLGVILIVAGAVSASCSQTATKHKDKNDIKTPVNPGDTMELCYKTAIDTTPSDSI